MGRWLALFFCLGGTWLLTNTDIRYFSLGWANQSSGSKETRLHAIGINY
jgi:hypothetical protein